MASERDMRLLDGRRVQLKDLIDAELLTPGAVLEFNRPRAGARHLAVVTDDARLQLEDGRPFAAPSRAAVEAADLRSVDGWLVWTHTESGRTLGQLRHDLLAATVKSSADATLDDEDATRSKFESRHEFLDEAFDRSATGAPASMPVRDLLSFWGAKVRGHRVVDRVLADLENHSLTTRPDFRRVALDTTVALVALTTDPAPDEPDEGAAPVESEAADVGLTLGNVPSALGGLTVVNPNDSLEKAMTLMRVRDFSQLAVLPTPRTLLGAITWRSIAKALAGGGEPSVRDAMEPAKPHPFDTDLIDALPLLYEHDFIFVTSSTNEVSGIVTSSDVVRLYGETATPFFLIGEIDHLLRRFIADEWTIEQVATICDPAGERTLDSHDDLGIGDYQRMLQEPERFAALGWPLDRVEFDRVLDEVREIRNAVAHFDPDPLGAAEVEVLGNFLHLLRELRR